VYFRPIIGYIVDDSSLIERVIIGESMKHFPYFAIRNTVEMQRQSGDGLLVVVEAREWCC